MVSSFKTTDCLVGEGAMSKWWDIRNPDNRAMLGWVGSGLAVVIASLWGAYIYFNQSKSGDGGGSIKVEASCGSAAAQGTMIGSSITTGGGGSTANCPSKSK
jgi:hypothetical protein